MGSKSKAIWLDCDPGHDDAIAILLAFYGKSKEYEGGLEVLGISTTHGNSTGLNTYLNAIKLVTAFGIQSDQCRVWRGSDRPILRKGRFDVGIHGEDGLGGVECLPDLENANVQQHLQLAGIQDQNQVPPADPLSLAQHQLNILQQRKKMNLPKISLIATGPLTNIALLLKMCPEDGKLLEETIDQIVLMGGSAGISGNRSPLAEWNIFVDPEAAKIVFDSKLKVVMAGLNVTHQAIFTSKLYDELTKKEALRQTKIRKLVSSAINFFRDSYANEFGFVYGPPIHDMLTIAYVLDPSLFFSYEPRSNAPLIESNAELNQRKRVPCKRFNVEIDTSCSQFTAGATIVDFYNQIPIEHEGWHKGGKNAIVLEFVDTERLWPLFFDALNRAEEGMTKYDTKGIY